MINKIKKIRIGVTIPGLVESGNSRMEVELNVSSSDDIDLLVRDAKLFLAEQLSGGDLKVFDRAIKYLHVKSTDEILLDKIARLEETRLKIVATNRELETATREAKQLMYRLDDIK